MSPIPRDNNPAELEAFETTCWRLGGFDDLINFEWVDGFLTGLATGLRLPTPAEWLPVMCGDTFDRVFADPADHAQAVKSLRTRLSVLVDQLDAEAMFDQPDGLRLAPLMAEWTADDRSRLVAEGEIDAAEAAKLATGAEWVIGFFNAVKAFSSSWPDVADEEAARGYGQLFEHIRVLLLPEDSDAYRQHLAEFYPNAAPDRDALIQEACFAVQELRLWNVDNAPRPETRRVEKTPGRNDPCPCGSGKKFKKCHGA